MSYMCNLKNKMNVHKKTETDLQIQKTFQQIQWREGKRIKIEVCDQDIQTAAAAAKSHQQCQTRYNPIDGSPTTMFKIDIQQEYIARHRNIAIILQ